jgi:hypothetical protein
MKIVSAGSPDGAAWGRIMSAKMANIRMGVNGPL